MPDYCYDHIHLVSPDPVGPAQFYEEMFNAQKVNERKLLDGRTSVELNLTGSRILVIQHSQPESATTPSKIDIGLEHFGIKTDDIETAVADLKAKGVQFRDEVREIRPGIKIAFLWGPENVLIELVQTSNQ